MELGPLAFHIEVLTPKQNTDRLDEDLQTFAGKYRAVLDAGHTACITDNPMGHLSFQATDVLAELALPVRPAQLMIHLNTFHAKPALDALLDEAARLGCRQILVVSGDGSERLPRLSPEALGLSVPTVTSVELLRYIRQRHPGVFVCGVAFNPYEPQAHELEKLRRKADAGAAFLITQPLLGRDDRIEALRPFGLPVIVNAWMSKKLHLLSECVGYPIPEDTPYDPMAALRLLRETYPRDGLYLSMLGFKTQFPRLREVAG